jgi:hypothetical protein
MRAFLVGLCLVMALVPSAFAKPTYILFDTSSSMKGGKRLSAQDQAQLVIDNLADDAGLSVIEMGGSCAVPTIHPPKPKREHAPFAPGAPSGSTPLGTALKATFEAARTTGADIYVFSDGGNYCGEVNICEVARTYLSVYPEIELHFDPIDPNDEDEEALGCLQSARQPIRQVAIPIDPAPGNPPEPHAWVGWLLLLTGAVLGISIGRLIHLWGGRMVAVLKHQREQLAKKEWTPEQHATEAERVKAEAAAAAAKLEAENKARADRGKKPKPEPKAKTPRHLTRMRMVVFRALWPIALVMAADVLLFFAFPNSFDQARQELWWFAETNFGSVFLTAVLAGFTGWALLRIWEFTLLRRDKISDEVMGQIKDAQRAAAAEQRKTERSNAVTKREAKTKALQDQNARLAAYAQEAFKAEVEAIRPSVTDQKLDEVAAKVAAVRQQLDTIAASLTDNARLSKYAKPSSRTNYANIALDMMTYDILRYDVVSDINAVLRAWERYKTAGDDAPDFRETILTFDTGRIAVKT